MKLIVLPRDGGKTLRALTLCAREGLYMVVANKMEAVRVFDMARSLGLEIPFPLTASEFFRHEFEGRGIRGFVFDNLDELIRHVAGSVPVTAITLTGPPMTEIAPVRALLEGIDRQIRAYNPRNPLGLSTDLRVRVGTLLSELEQEAEPFPRPQAPRGRP